MMDTLLEMEARLNADSAGTHCHHLCRRLEGWSRQLQQQLDRGLSPDDFQTVNKLKTSAEIAVAVVEHIWNHTHSRR